METEDTAPDIHQSVLLDEVIEGLQLRPDSIIVDATLGSGGHSEAICRMAQGNVRLIGFDVDADAIERASVRVKQSGCEIEAIRANFRTMGDQLSKLGITEVHGILFDLGWSSVQLERSGRGFSFMRDEPLLMTLDANVTDETLTAREIINSWQEESIADIIFGYGEERFARRIAAAIVWERERRPIETTKQLADVVRAAVPAWYRIGRINPATKTFQALRIAVNDELQALPEALTQAFDLLAPTGRLCVISFHSLEDRIVKNLFRDWSHEEKGELVTKKPIVPNEAETMRNPRARSAKLRIIEKL